LKIPKELFLKSSFGGAQGQSPHAFCLIAQWVGTHGECRDAIFHAISVPIDFRYLLLKVLEDPRNFFQEVPWWGAGAKPLRSFVTPKIS
jgi:hypothetical protein